MDTSIALIPKGPVPPLADLREHDLVSLIDYVLVRFHERHRAQLTELIDVAQTVETVHDVHPDCPTGLSELLQHIGQELDSHMMKEERVLFPMLRNGMREQAQAPINVMKMEHGQHEHSLDALLQLTRNLTVPADACKSWRYLYDGLGEFVNDLRRHIELENEVVFA